MDKTCIVIPCYNEAVRMPEAVFIEQIKATEFSFCFVNDGSKDSTLEVLLRIKQSNPGKVLVIDQQPNRGKAESVRNGIKQALNWKDFRYVAYLDADLATPVSEILFLQEIAVSRNKKMVFGSRLKRLGVMVDRKSSRHYTGRIIATIISSILGLPTYDTQCGAKVFEADLASKLFAENFISRWLFDVELFFRAKKLLGEEIYHLVYEAPLNQWTEVGESKVSLWYMFKLPIELFKIRNKYK